MKKVRLLAMALVVAALMILPALPRKVQASNAEPSVPATLPGAASPLAMQMAMGACIDTNFAAATGTPIGVGDEPGSIAMGDFNNDGNADIAVPNQVSDNVNILLGNGTGGFTNIGSVASGGLNPCAVTAGDFNRDGKQDLAVCNSLDATSPSCSEMATARSTLPRSHRSALATLVLTAASRLATLTKMANRISRSRKAITA